VTRPSPDVSWESRAFWGGGERGQLMIHRCHACGGWFHPPAPACYRCRSTDVRPEPASGRATVVAFTINEHQWLASFPPPYVIAIVELADDPSVRLTTNIVGCEPAAVHIGMSVEVEFDQAAADVWVPIFHPVVPQAAS